MRRGRLQFLCRIKFALTQNLISEWHSQNTGTNYVNAVWSPDGSKIAAISAGIVTMNADGSKQGSITEDECRSWGAVNKKDLQTLG